MDRPPTADMDIYRTAALLVKQHSADAWFHAATRADELLIAGDMDGRAIWFRMLEAVNVLQATEPKGAVH